MIRLLKDPYSGLGAELSLRSPFGTRYALCPSIGVTDKLLELSLEATPPFDTNKINTLGAEDSWGSGLVILELRVSLLWITVGFELHRTRAGSWLNP